jgi:hypothetical protein
VTDDDVLELRIHGVNNTPPSGMLELPEDAVVEYEGDSLGSFWRPRPEFQHELGKHDPGRVPEGVLREAYSWGGMARNSIGGASGAGKIVSGAARLGWTLLLPFSLLNMSYWSRCLMKTRDEAHEGWANSGGAAVIRLCALLLTLLMSLTGSVLSLDVVGLQCYADPRHPCSGLPSFLNFLGSWDVSNRLALLSPVPVAVVGLLYALTVISKVRYTEASSAARAWERQGNAEIPADAADAVPVWPLLRTKGFWRPILILAQTARMHLAATGVLVSLITAWYSAFGTGPNCENPSNLLGNACRTQVTDAGPRARIEFIVAVACLILLIGIAIQVMRLSDASADIKAKSGSAAHGNGTVVLAILAIVIFLLQIGVLAGWRAQPPASSAVLPPEILGLSALPAILVALIIGFALSALTWRYVTGKWRSKIMLALGISVSLLLLFSSLDFFHHHLTQIFDGAALLVVCGIIGVVMASGGGVRKSSRKYEAWGGCGPGIFIILSLLFGMLLSSAVVVAIANLLNGSHSAASLAGDRPASMPAGSAYLLIPRPYVWFGVMLQPMLLVFLALLLLVLWTTRAARSQIPQGLPATSSDQPVTPSDEPETGDLSGYPPVSAQVLRARWLASLAQRAERYVGALAVLGGAALIATVAVAVSGWVPVGQAGIDGLANWALGSGLWCLALAGAATIGLAFGGSAAGGTRPLGVLWDLVCFLPKAAHPFGPPCYAERVVPELLGRYGAWLTRDAELSPGRSAPAKTPVPGRRIILSAHSLGAVLAVASIFALPRPAGRDDSRPDAADGSAVTGKIALLTYGSQLRAYFSRILPDLLGPEVLGSRPCCSAQFFSVDPWQRECVDEEQPWATDGQDTLRQILTGHDVTRWINLWRRTDYIGFPSVQYRGEQGSSPIDRLAEEVDDSRYLLEVLTHSDYPRVPAYIKSLRELRRMS